MAETKSKRTRGVRITLGLSLALVFSMSAYASISIPPVEIVGSLQTPEGFELTTGDLRFEFIPDPSGETVSVDAVVGSFGEDLNFHVSVPIRVAPLPTGVEALELGGGKTYTTHVYYNNEKISESQIQSPYTPVQGSTLGPFQYVVEPKGPTLSVSKDIDFGYVPVGNGEERSFEIVNVGTEPITGSIRLANANSFTLTDGGSPVGVLPFNLQLGESLFAAVRFAPQVVNERLTDMLVISSNAGAIARSVEGNSSHEDPTPTPTPEPAPFRIHIEAPAQIAGITGSTTEIEASVVLMSSLDPIEGWYLGVCTGDSSLCSIKEVRVGDAAIGAGTADVHIREQSDICSGSEALLAMWVDSNLQSPLNPAQTPHELMKITLQINFAETPGVSECLIDFVDGLRLPSSPSAPLVLDVANLLQIAGLPFGVTHGLELSGAAIDILSHGPETPTPTITPTRTPTGSPTPTLNLEYDIAPDFPDGIVNSLDLIRWVDFIGQKTASPQLLFDFARFWTRTSSIRSETAEYEVVFEGTWSEQTHPTDFPTGGHFTGLIGATHNSTVTFWEEGGLASPGIETMAETGSKAFIAQEVSVAIVAGRAGSILSGGAISPPPDSVSVDFVTSKAFPLVTLVSMISPSPDWFVGVSGVSLYENDVWVENLVVPLLPFDAGTDSGTNYASPDEDTIPQESISQIEGSPFLIGETVPPLGTLTFRRID